jgi:hypothetical protein
LNTFCYDFVALLNRVSRRGAKTSPADDVAHEAAVRKGGFPNMGSHAIHSSYQTALPQPLNVTASSEQAAIHPIPAIKSNAAWDMMDGKTGMGPELTSALALEHTKVCTMIRVDCSAHLSASSLFENLVTRSQAQFTALSQFIGNNYGQSYTSSGDKEEAHRFTMEVVGGAFEECYKVCCQAADRTSLSYAVMDAGRSMWAALQTTELHAEMMLMGCTGHPLLSPYTVSHSYRHRVARKELTQLETKLQAMTTAQHATDALAKKLKLKHGV